MTSLKQVSVTINRLESDRDIIKFSLIQQLALVKFWAQKIMRHRCCVSHDSPPRFHRLQPPGGYLHHCLTDEAGVVIFNLPTLELHLIYNSVYDGIILAEDWSIE